MTAHPNFDTRDALARSGSASTLQFVTFRLGAESFAVPLGRVKEIIRMPGLTRLPLAPQSVEGITNLRGLLLPVVNLRHAFGMTQVQHDDATRIVVLDIGKPVGIVVDRVLAVQSIDKTRIDGTDRIGDQINSEFVVGAIRNEGTDGAVSVTMILDIEAIVVRECTLSCGPSNAETQRESRSSEAPPASKDHAQDNFRQFVSFVVEGQEYALPIADVQEIVHVPKSIASVPNASPSVIGMVTLRERLLPIVSLRSILGLPLRPVSPDDRVVVVSLSSSGHTMTVGVLTDAVREVLRVGADTIDPMPPMLATAGGVGEIAAVCRLDGGRRLVSVLDPDRMFQLPEIKASAAAGSAQTENESDMASEASLRATADEEQIVVFKLGDEEFGVASENVQEIVRLPERLIRVPNAPDFIEGIMNLRGTIVPLVDQRRRFQLPPMERNERQRVVVFTRNGVRSGFIVDSVVEVRRISTSQIAPAPELSQRQNQLIRRVANLPDRKRMIQLIEVEQLLDMQDAAASTVAAVA